MSEAYKLYKNIYCRPVDDGVVALYNPMKDHDVVFISGDIFDELMHVPLRIEYFGRPIFERLIEGKFIVPIDFDESIPYRRIGERYDPMPRIGLMYIILTTECNYRCTYCFIEENLLDQRNSPSLMTEMTCNNAIDYFLEIVDKEIDPQVIFYGGEPLANRNVFLTAVKRLRDEEARGNIKNLRIVLNTNAALVDDTLAKFCSE
ncbi:MAG: 4Fe-4S cluster-binding domain-containing protein, partial [Chloroflexi bacterium]|nr:4Fe-4S cluster-binding domain-containing protein [Chloroflexota bacterium]